MSGSLCSVSSHKPCQVFIPTSWKLNSTQSSSCAINIFLSDVANACRLADRLESIAQYQKQEALLVLAGRCKQLGTGSSTMDYGHRLLTMLYYTSDSPVNAIYHPKMTIDQLQHSGFSPLSLSLSAFMTRDPCIAFA